jgi:hypothetical protein
VSDAADIQVTEAPPVAPQTPAGFDPATTLALVLTYPDGAMPAVMAAWLSSRWEGHMQNVIAWNQKGPVDVVRCQAIHQFVLSRTDLKRVLMLDRDMEPGPETDALLHSTAPLAAAIYPIGDMRGWASENAAHCGCMMVAVEVFRKLAEEKDVPLFCFPRTRDNTRVLGCECGWFVGRARKAGFPPPLKVGWCGHRPFPK